MAQVDIKQIMEYMGNDMKRALEDAVSDIIPDSNVDKTALFKAFCRAVGRKCSAWEEVPDNYVEKKCHTCRKKA